MGTGKSTVGRLVAGVAGAPFVDLDERIAERAGQPIADVFTREGEAGFRSLEAAALEEVLSAPGPRVVALGGGALLDLGRRRAALARCRVVTLTATTTTIAGRTAASGRPLLDSAPYREARIRELLEQRAGVYAESHGWVPTDDRSPDDVARAVVRLWDDPAIAVPLGSRSYAVRIAPEAAPAVAELARALAPSSVYLVTDTTVEHLAAAPIAGALAGAGLRAVTTAIAPGEDSKRLATVERLLRWMIEDGADRDALVVGLGGGVVTDLAGFVAATLLRGVRWIAVPTTLLAMVDASVGGKTGVDLGPAKNAVGAFHQPSGVVVAPRHVLTESPRAYVGGLAEVVKSALVGDTELFDEVESRVDDVLTRDQDVVRLLVERSIAVKAGIVTRDEREAGERAFLNFGHTLGHALEAEGAFHRLTHGEAVSLGMVAALRLGERLGVTPRAEAARVVRLLQRLGLPTDLEAQPLEAALQLVGLDKKRRAGSVRVVLLRALGAPVLHPMTEATFSSHVLALR